MDKTALTHVPGVRRRTGERGPTGRLLCRARAERPYRAAASRQTILLLDHAGRVHITLAIGSDKGSFAATTVRWEDKATGRNNEACHGRGAVRQFVGHCCRAFGGASLLASQWRF